MNATTEQPSAIRWYYEGLKQNVYRAVKCKKCSTVTFPPTGCCEHCGSWEVEGMELSGDATLLFATHNITPACHPRFEKIAPYVYGHLQLREGPIVQAIILGVDPTPKALHTLFNRGPVPAKAHTIAMDDLPVLGFRVKL
jgi:hypothetical protein